MEGPNPSVASEREQLVIEALSWRGTPYHNHGRVKGVGADCLTFLAGAFENAGLVPPIEIPNYPPQWHLHHSDEKYLDGLLRYCVEVDGPPDRVPLPGDIVLWRFGRTYSHGAIVVEWPTVIHAFTGRKIARADADRDAPLAVIGERNSDHGKRRPRRFFALQRWT